MERMEVDQCAGASGGALRRSNSAPMITTVSDGMAVLSPAVSARHRRSSVSINPSCPSQEDVMESTLRGNLQRLSASNLITVPPVSQWYNQTALWFQSQESGITPNSSPSPSRRFRPAISATVSRPALTPLKRKGGVESDSPPKKLFVTGVADSIHCNSSSYTVSVSQETADSPIAEGTSPQSSPLSLSPLPTFTPFSSHQHPGH